VATGSGGIDRRTLVIAGVGTAIAAIPSVLAAVLLAGKDSFIFPAGTVLGGVEAGGLSASQVLAHLESSWAAFLQKPAVFRLNGREWQPTVSDIGLRADFRGPIKELVDANPRGGIIDRVFATPIVQSVDVPVVVYDRETARRYIARLAAGFDQPASRWSLVPIGGGRIELSSGQIGRVVDVDRGLRDLEAGIGKRRVGSIIELQYREDRPHLTAADADRAIETAQRMVGEPIFLMHGTRGWVMKPLQLSDALVFQTDASRVTVGFEFTRFNELFQRIESTLTAEPRKNAFEFDTVNDRVTAFVPGNPGQLIDRAELERRINEVARGEEDRRLDVPLIILNKEFDVASNPLGIKDLLSTGSSIYKGSPEYRDHNIAVGSAKLDGMILRPGETFSFNERIGKFLLGEGWVEGSVIVRDETEQGIGGGICQVSTTLFRAVLAAGLPIEERWPHLYRVRYYEMGSSPIGSDATIFSPGPDLKFSNDLDSPIMIRSRLDRRLATLDLEIWGASDGRLVTIGRSRLSNWKDPPEDQGIVDSEEDPDFEDQIEFAKRGVQAELKRIIEWPDGRTKTSVFRSNYVAWPNRFVVGINEAKLRFPSAYNKWFDENPELATHWGVSRVPGVPSDPDAPSG
jgi:vancomycin resistance protein YoaR